MDPQSIAVTKEHFRIMKEYAIVWFTILVWDTVSVNNALLNRGGRADERVLVFPAFPSIYSARDSSRRMGIHPSSEVDPTEGHVPHQSMVYDRSASFDRFSPSRAAFTK